MVYFERSEFWHRTGSEGARRATGDLADRGAAAGVRDPEVSEKAKRRRFSAEYKLRIVREADARPVPKLGPLEIDHKSAA